MDTRDVRNAFAESIRLPDEQIDLADSALLIAQEEYPELDRLRYLEMLDELADGARMRLGGETDLYVRVNVLSEYLFDEEKFTGNESDYYDPRNSFLNEVLERRLGIPITLSLVYMEVGRRLGMAVVGVGMPGHFLAKYLGEREEIVIDPFRRGIIMSAEDCRQLLRRVTGDVLPVSTGDLPVLGPKEMLNRMLNNLKGIYLARKDYPRSLAAVERMLLVNPKQPEEIRDRGLIRYQLGEVSEAIFDLDTYLNGTPDAPDADAMERRMREMRRELRE
ncbi:MAG TPA: tetratricopeptide repeat protein [Dehalococcoidia bacterium]|nr:tetratricopeptide repeat protein [Dehalococcoidia bacterium]